MNDTNSHERRIITNSRCNASKSRTKVLHSFADSLSDIRLTPDERDYQRAERMYHAARLCATRGDLQRAQKLLTRSYAICNRLHLPETACNVARARIEIEHILMNAAAIRLWTARLDHWQDMLQRQSEQQEQQRREYYAVVLLWTDTCKEQTFERYVCKELHHIVPHYRLCADGNFTLALEMLDAEAILRSNSVYLQDEVRWLRFRILFSTQRYQDAQLLLQQMNRQTAATHRMAELLILANAYNELLNDFYDGMTERRKARVRLSTFMNSFSILASEPSGMYLAVFVYEITRLLVEHRFELANQRLAALRVRMHRCRPNGNLEELRILLLIIGYILSTSHRHKRNFPHHLMTMFYEGTAPIPYPQQGIIAYSELAYRLLRHLGYR